MLIKQLAVLANSMLLIPLEKKEVRFSAVLLYTAETTACSTCFSEIKTSLHLLLRNLLPLCTLLSDTGWDEKYVWHKFYQSFHQRACIYLICSLKIHIKCNYKVYLDGENIQILSMVLEGGSYHHVQAATLDVKNLQEMKRAPYFFKWPNQQIPDAFMIQVTRFSQENKARKLSSMFFWA